MHQIGENDLFLTTDDRIMSKPLYQDVQKRKPDQPTNEQRRQAIALIKSFPDKSDRRELTLKIGLSQFQIIIDKKISLA